MPQESLALDRITRWRSEFQAAIQQQLSPKIEVWLAEADEGLRTLLLTELLKVELEHRRKAGETPTRSEYAVRFRDRRALDAVFGADGEDDGADTQESGRGALASTAELQHSEKNPALASTVAVGETATDAPSAKSLGRFGNYELLEELGQGGMGVVYQARQLNAGGRLVALKVIRPDKLERLSGEQRAQALERFRVEARAAARLQHENLVTVYDVGEVEGRPYYSMQYVPGRSLRALVKKKKPLPVRRAAEILLGAAAGVHEAHRHGVLHRDLKPENVLIEAETGRPLVADFGLAKLAEEGGVTMTGDVFGTPQYMAPEQARDAGRVTVAGDVYGLGATLYCLLTGRPPFTGELYELLRQVQEDDPAPPRQLNPEVDADLETLTLRCLEKDPAQRPASADELAQELGRYLRGEPIASRPVGRVERCWRWCKRRPAAAGLLATSLLACLLAGVGLWLWERYKLAETRSALAEKVAEQQKELYSQQKQLADTQTYYASISEARENAVSREAGWTWASLEKLSEAAALDVESRSPVELRSLAAEALGSVDIRLTPLVAPIKGGRPLAIAFSPDSRRVAFGPSFTRPTCPIFVYDTATGKVLARYSINTAFTYLQGVQKFFGAKEVNPHEGTYSLAFSPDGRWLAAGTRQGHIYVWDTAVEAPEPIHWPAGAPSVNKLAFSADGRELFASTDTIGYWDSGTLQRWDVANRWQALPGLEVEHRDFALSPDGRWLAFTNGELLLRHADLSDRAGWPDVDAKGAVGFSPDSRFIAAARSHEIRIADIPGEVVQTLHDPLAPEAEPGWHLAFAADGSLLFSSGNDRTARVWDVASGEIVAKAIGTGVEIPVVVASPDGRWLAVGDSSEVSLHELRLPEIAATLAYTGHPICGIDLSADGKTLVCLSESERCEQSTISVWNAETGDLVRESTAFLRPDEHLRFRGLLDSSHASPGHPLLAIHPEGTSAAVVSSLLGASVLPLPGVGQLPQILVGPLEREVKVLQEDQFEIVGDPARISVVEDPQASNGRAVRIAAQSPNCEIRLRLTPDQAPMTPGAMPDEGWAVLAAVRIEAQDYFGQELTVATVVPENTDRLGFDLSSLSNSYYRFYQVDFHHDNAFRGGERAWIDHVILGSESEQIRAIWIDAITLVPIVENHSSWPRVVSRGPLAYSPDGKRLWGVVGRKHLVSWDAATHAVRSHWDNRVMLDAAGNGSLVSLAAGRRWIIVGDTVGWFHIISAQTGLPVDTEVQKDFLNKRIFSSGGAVTAAALSPDEDLVVLGTDKGHVRVVSLPDCQTIADLKNHRRAVSSLSLSRDGALLAVGARDQTVRLWRCVGGRFEEVLTLKGFHGPVQAVRLSADAGKLAVLVEGERAVRFWRLDELNLRLSKMGLPLLKP